MREKLLFNYNWRFHEGEIDSGRYPSEKGPLYQHAKAESANWGPASKNYLDNTTWWPKDKIGSTENWQTVILPHDYVISHTPDKEYNEGLGFVETPNAWYRKTFKLDESDRGKHLTVYFEGVTNCCTVYVNGCIAKRNFCGYVPFEVDITDYAVYGDQQNVIAVHIDASSHEGWWYDGGGIYRNTWLIKTDMVSVDMYGVYVAPKKISDSEWEVPIETTLRNDDYKNHRVYVKNDIADKDGNVVATVTQSVNVPLENKATIKQKITLNDPMLWDTETPNLYYCKTTVLRGNTEIDNVTTHFGFRTIRFDSEHGFFLNGKHVVIKGVCCHEDYGLQGKAVSDRIKRYRVKLLKEMGCNGYRTSHYCQSEQTMDAFDKEGFLVMDETRWFGSCDEYLDQLEVLVKRDRSRPSVIMWSLGNEEYHHVTPTGKRFHERMAALVKRLDTTRPVTSAISVDPINASISNSMDIFGINYNLKQYDGIHEKHPELPIFSSENCATGTTRGWYMDDCFKRGYINAYDHDTNEWFRGRENTWKFFMEREWIAGGYQWAGIEHRGEAIWPRLCSQSGALDLFLQKKDAFYQNQSLWSERHMIHILPHWNWRGREGDIINVWTYTNCEQAELFLNGKSLGKKDIEKYGHGSWGVEYTPGELVAKGYIGGKEVVSDRVVTSGKPYALKLTMQTEALFADRFDVAVLHCTCVDENGNTVPDATPYVSFNTTGNGFVIGTGSDIADHNIPACIDRKMRAGVIAALIGTRGEKKPITVYASAEGLLPAKLVIDVTDPDNEHIR